MPTPPLPRTSAPLAVVIHGLGVSGRAVVREAISRAAAWHEGDRERGAPLHITAVTAIDHPGPVVDLLAHELGPRAGHGPTLGRMAAIVREGTRCAIELGDVRVEVLGATAALDVPELHRAAIAIVCGEPAAGIAGLPGSPSRIVRVAGVDPTARAVLVGVHDDALAEPARGLAPRVLHGGSAAVQAIAPVLHVLQRTCGVRWALAQTLADRVGAGHAAHEPSEPGELRLARASLHDLVPRIGGDQRVLHELVPALAGKLSVAALQLPPVHGARFEVTAVLDGGADLERALDVLRDAGAAGPLRGLLAVEQAPLHSGDVRGRTESAWVDAGACHGAGPLVQIVGWYDPITGPAARALDLALRWASAAEDD